MTLEIIAMCALLRPFYVNYMSINQVVYLCVHVNRSATIISTFSISLEKHGNMKRRETHIYIQNKFNGYYFRNRIRSFRYDSSEITAGAALHNIYIEFQFKMTASFYLKQKIWQILPNPFETSSKYFAAISSKSHRT